jgi:hypothetical protein
VGNRISKTATAIGFAFLVASSGPASAQSSAERDPLNRADLQCMSIAAAAAGMMEEGSQAQLGLAAAMSYFLGRLDARAPTTNWLEVFGTYLLSDFENEAKPQGERCSTEMTAFGDRMTAWSEKMQSRERKEPAKQGPQRQRRP